MHRYTYTLTDNLEEEESLHRIQAEDQAATEETSRCGKAVKGESAVDRDFIATLNVPEGALFRVLYGEVDLDRHMLCVKLRDLRKAVYRAEQHGNLGEDVKLRKEYMLLRIRVNKLITGIHSR